MKTDTQLQHDVIASLIWDLSIDTNRIRVCVVNGGVALSGQVGSYSQRLEIERVARRVTGIQSLSVNIRVTGAVASAGVQNAPSMRDILRA